MLLTWFYKSMLMKLSKDGPAYNFLSNGLRKQETKLAELVDR